MELHSSKFVLAVQEGHPTYMGLINPKDASDQWILNQLKDTHDLYQFKDRNAYNAGVRIWKRYKSNLRRGKYDEWILSRYQGLVEPLGYNSAEIIPTVCLLRSWPPIGTSLSMPSSGLWESGRRNLGASQFQVL